MLNNETSTMGVDSPLMVTIRCITYNHKTYIIPALKK